MRDLKVILAFEYLAQVKSKVFLFMTAAFVALVLILANIPNFAGLFASFGGGSPEPAENPQGSEVVDDLGAAGETAAIYDPAGVYTDAVLSFYTPIEQWEHLDTFDETALKAAVESEEYVLALAVDGLAYTLIQPGADWMGGLSPRFDEMVRQTYQKGALQAQGLDAAAVDDLLNAAPVQTFISVGKDAQQSFFLAYVMLMVLYMAILLYGQTVTMSVITEKTSKAMELLITSTKPAYLIFGKVIGVGLAGLTQFVLVLGTALVALDGAKEAWAVFAPPVAAMLDFSATGSLFLYAAVFFLLGFFSYAFLYAAFASTVSRLEEAGTVTTVPVLLFVAAFFVAISSLSDPSATYATICSFVPFLSPLVLFIRICMTDVPLLQIVCGIGVNLITIIAVGVLSAKIYRAGVMLYGKAPRLRDILKYMIQR